MSLRSGVEHNTPHTVLCRKTPCIQIKWLSLLKNQLVAAKVIVVPAHRILPTHVTNVRRNLQTDVYIAFNGPLFLAYFFAEGYRRRERRVRRVVWWFLVISIVRNAQVEKRQNCHNPGEQS